MGVVPTPAVAWVCAQRGGPGAVISASHNPWSDNGIKFFAAGGRKLSDELEAELENALDAVVAAGVEFDLSVDSNTDTHAVAEWCDAVASSVVAVAPMRIVIDCANGAASFVAPGIFRGLGLEVEVLHAQPDGRNINDACGSTHPEDLQQAVLASGAALGLAFDGDADRLLAVDERGELVDGDQLIALFARDLRERGGLAGNRVVVTVMSNLGFRLAMDEQGIEVVETPVGDRHVLEALARTSSSLGGEQSGHIVFADRATTGDGVLSGVQLVDLVGRTQTPLSTLAAGVMDRLPQVLRNVRLEHRRDDIAEAIAGEIAAVEQSLGARGRVLIRLSGTEPLVRVMVEAPTLEQAEDAADNLAAAVIRACSA
jgi:phosphoglucosamine mutase